MRTNVHKHLYGMYSVLKARFNLINKSIGHTTTQGEENENELRNLLIDFLPSNYGIGSGIIIGTDGTASKQIDIIIYDKNRADYTLSANSKIFLADHVIAVIEIKTTYGTGTNSSLSQALENIQSVKSLKMADRKWLENSFNAATGMFELCEYAPSPPLGIIFFFSAVETISCLNLEKFIAKMKPHIDQIPIQNQPDLLFSLDHSIFFRHIDIGVKSTATQQFMVSAVQDSSDTTKAISITGLTDKVRSVIDFSGMTFASGDNISTVTLTNLKSTSSLQIISGESLTSEPIIYKVANLQGQYYLLDQYRAFLIFVWSIEKMLSIKRTNKAWDPADYFGKAFFLCFDYFNDLNNLNLQGESTNI